MLALIRALLDVIAKWFDYQKQDRLLNAGNAEERAKQAEVVNHAIIEASEARDRANDDIRGIGNTDELPDDGFRRD